MFSLIEKWHKLSCSDLTVGMRRKYLKSTLESIVEVLTQKFAFIFTKSYK